MKNGKSDKQLRNTSKFISLILRHQPEAIGITLDEHGWADAQELIPKSRLYVHLSSDMETARKVGSRHGKPVIYEIDCHRMTEDGYRFFLSSNHVWLIEEVPARYLKKL